MQFDFKLMKSLYGSWEQTPAVKFCFDNKQIAIEKARELATVTQQEVRINETGSSQGTYIHPQLSLFNPK